MDPKKRLMEQLKNSSKALPDLFSEDQKLNPSLVNLSKPFFEDREFRRGISGLVRDHSKEFVEALKEHAHNRILESWQTGFSVCCSYSLLQKRNVLEQLLIVENILKFEPDLPEKLLGLRLDRDFSEKLKLLFGRKLIFMIEEVWFDECVRPGRALERLFFTKGYLAALLYLSERFKSRICESIEVGVTKSTKQRSTDPCFRSAVTEKKAVNC